MSKAAAKRLAVLFRDLLLGLALFFTLSAASAAAQGHSLSSLFSKPTSISAGEQQEDAGRFSGEFEPSATYVRSGKEPETRTAMAILAAVFSAMVAFNLWFYRHLRRVYASPRHGGWRRG